ncbi:YsnF/AvaK domain-containing protein [Planococcus sp. ISL-109]|uniref:YsnF/AvaK domain-containing protein n=1 Tax=Planococcus sp. ISL-109 TaxID=2819166 RepID=UPI001BEB5117|nr:YsnF/AvaK domain-containing protein [Planococcus sp. ISL-109]MBT2583527.1 YsnF/AvaK domain-containing protein [Planococcus sp. ISL-109]
MTNNKFMGTFETETEVLKKIDEMKAQGSREEDMYVMARNEDQISMVRGRTDIDYKSSEGGWMDKFMGFLSGNEPTREAFSNMGVDDQEADRYYEDVQSGKILLFVDREFGANYEGQAPYDNTSTGNVDSTTSQTKVDNSAVASDGLTVDTNEENDVAYNTERDALGSDTAGAGKDTGTGFGLGTDDRATGGTLPSGAGHDTTGTNRSVEDIDRDLGRVDTEEERLQLHEERLQVNKERVQTGEVHVDKHVVEEEQSLEVPVEREEVYVERRPVNEETTTGTHDYTEGEDIHVPVSEERVDVTKKDVVSEEIAIGKNKVQDTEHVSETVRKEEVDIHKDGDLVEEDETSRTDRNRDKL